MDDPFFVTVLVFETNWR